MNSIRINRRRYFFLFLPLVVIVATLGVIILVRTVRESQLQAEAARRLQEFTEKALQVPLSYEGWSGEIIEIDPEFAKRHYSKYERGWIFWQFKHRDSNTEVVASWCHGHPREIRHRSIGCGVDESEIAVTAQVIGEVPFQVATSQSFHPTDRRYCLHSTWRIDGSWLAPRFFRDPFKLESRPYRFELFSYVTLDADNVEETDRLSQELASLLLPDIHQAFFNSL